jgi:hypothetical protein
LKPALLDGASLIARTRIDNVMKFLRSFHQSWSNLKWTLRLFEVLVSRTGLSLNSSEGPVHDAKAINPFLMKTADGPVELLHPGDGTLQGNNHNLEGNRNVDLLCSGSKASMIESTEFPSFVMGHPAENWLQDLFDVSLANIDDRLTLT